MTIGPTATELIQAVALFAYCHFTSIMLFSHDAHAILEQQQVMDRHLLQTSVLLGSTISYTYTLRLAYNL
jgi:hypothetical protein